MILEITLVSLRLPSSRFTNIMSLRVSRSWPYRYHTTARLIHMLVAETLIFPAMSKASGLVN